MNQTKPPINPSPDYRDDATVPIGQVVMAAWNFLLRNWQTLYVHGAPYVLATGAMIWVGTFVPIKSPASGLVLPLFTFSMMFLWMMSAAQYRLALGLPEKGLVGLDFGMDELRLFAAYMLVGLVAYIVAIVAGILAWLASSGILLAGMDPSNLPTNPEEVLPYFIEHAGMRFYILLGLSAGAMWLVLLYLFSRFVPAFPAAIAEKRIIVFEAANWTKGEGLRIAIASVLAFLPVFLLMLPDYWGTVQEILNTLAHPDQGVKATSEAAQAASRDRFVWQMLTILLVPALNGLRVGLYVTLYNGLRPQE